MIYVPDLLDAHGCGKKKFDVCVCVRCVWKFFFWRQWCGPVLVIEIKIDFDRVWGWTDLELWSTADFAASD